MSSHLTVPVSERDHILGPSNASITLLEYGDYECPHCGEAHPIVRQIIETFGGWLRFGYRHFPLATMHPHAELAAEAAEAAGSQDRFWDMHDLLFENQDALDAASLLASAAALGLDVDRFRGELSAHVHTPRVREDFVSGARSGVNGTPTFFINGIRHDGSYDLVSLTVAIERAAPQMIV